MGKRYDAQVLKAKKPAEAECRICAPHVDIVGVSTECLEHTECGLALTGSEGGYVLRIKRIGDLVHCVKPPLCCISGVFFFLYVFLLIYSCSLSHGMSVPQEIKTDLEGDGRYENVVLSEEGSNSLVIWRDGKKIWQGIPRKWNPWKIQVADVDGDGMKEIIIGVYKSTRFFPEPHNCLFVFGWDGEEAFPKWLGSRLSKPFEDFAFAELDGNAGEELVSLEVTQDGGRCLVVYSWCGFGFVGVWQSQNFAYVSLSRHGADEVLLECSSGEHFLLERNDNSYALRNVQMGKSHTTGESKNE